MTIEHRGISRDGITCTDDDCKCHDPAQNPLHYDNRPVTSLKPCPFCGASAKVERDSGSYGYTYPTVWIQCSVQKWVRTPAQQETMWIQGKGHIDVADGALQKCIDVWNRRA